MFFVVAVLVAAFLMWRQRSEGVIVVRALPPRPRASKLASSLKDAAIRDLIERNQFIEATQLYRRLYGVDLPAAKAAIDRMMLEQ